MKLNWAFFISEFTLYIKIFYFEAYSFLLKLLRNVKPVSFLMLALR